MVHSKKLTQILTKAGLSEETKKYQPSVFGHLSKLDAPVGSTAYDDWALEMEEYAIHGYKPKNMSKITGKHFTFLNLAPIRLNDPEAPPELDRKILSLPFYRDMDHGYYSIWDDCKIDHTGMIVGKARDKGFSMLNAAGITQEYTFFEENEMGVAAGSEAQTVALSIKIDYMLDNMHDAFRHNRLTNNAKQITSGFEMEVDGVLKKLGYQSSIYSRTVANPNIFKGERMSAMIFEEAGEIDKLKEAYEATKFCFMNGNTMFGVPIVGGTGGNIEKGSKGFMEMWKNHKSYQLRKVFIPGYKVMDGFFDYATGKSNEEDARKWIIKERKRIEEGGDQEQLQMHIQNYPIREQEIFLKTSQKFFDLIKINKARQRILSDPNVKRIITKGYYDFDDTVNQNRRDVASAPDLNSKMLRQILGGSKPIFIPDETGPVQVLHHDLVREDGRPMYQNINTVGIDSVDQEIAETSDSQLAATVYRRFVNFDVPCQLPVAILKMRTPDPSLMYRQALLMTMAYHTQALVEYSKIRIFDYWKFWGAMAYARKRPTSIHTANSKARNEYGVYMSGDVKQKGIEQIRVDIAADRLEDYWFIELLDDLADFGDKNVDLGMSLLLAKLQDFDMSWIPTNETGQTELDSDAVKYIVKNGRVVPIVMSSNNSYNNQQLKHTA
jgi:hypothetical protein